MHNIRHSAIKEQSDTLYSRFVSKGTFDLLVIYSQKMLSWQSANGYDHKIFAVKSYHGSHNALQQRINAVSHNALQQRLNAENHNALQQRHNAVVKMHPCKDIML
jgi:hypothetical protein